MPRKGRAMEASVAIQVLPQNTESDAETCRIVDEAIAYIMSKFPDAYVGPFETAIEGDYDLCMEVLAEVNRIACPRADRANFALTGEFLEHKRRVLELLG